MPKVFIGVAVAGLVYFGVRLVIDPTDWLSSVVGTAACLLILARNAAVVRGNATATSSPQLQDVRDRTMLDDLLSGGRVVLYKHSTTCPVSAVVIDEVLRFSRARPDWRVYLLKVIEQRELSDAVATTLGVAHASPQVLVLKDGQCVWSGSHREITTDALRRAAS